MPGATWHHRQEPRPVGSLLKEGSGPRASRAGAHGGRVQMARCEQGCTAHPASSGTAAKTHRREARPGGTPPEQGARKPGTGVVLPFPVGSTRVGLRRQLLFAGSPRGAQHMQDQ